ncbi:MAG: hypothetical protein KDD27_07820 [Saprospiraceae bacterium]|nr:hypothetical protein [Saprospiraceae bacterium]
MITLPNGGKNFGEHISPIKAKTNTLAPSFQQSKPLTLTLFFANPASKIYIIRFDQNLVAFKSYQSLARRTLKKKLT